MCRNMKPYYAIAALFIVLSGHVMAQPPAPKKTGNPQVLLLSNFQIVEGDVERIGDQYVVRVGKEVAKYPVSQVACVGESRDMVFRQMFSRAQSSVTPGGNGAALVPFAARVQPILTNLCASCHAKADHKSEFKLQRVQEGFADPEASGRNAAAVVKFLTKDNPVASPFLVKTINAHGGQRDAALKDRNHPAYQNLEWWVRAVVIELAPTPVAAKPSTPMVVTPLKEDPYDPREFNKAKESKR